MARGESGRIILEVDPALKKQIYTSLDRRGQTLKDWFLEAVNSYLLEANQLRLDLDNAVRDESREKAGG